MTEESTKKAKGPAHSKSAQERIRERRIAKERGFITDADLGPKEEGVGSPGATETEE